MEQSAKLVGGSPWHVMDVRIILVCGNHQWDNRT
jgi:hypothetical protein